MKPWIKITLIASLTLLPVAAVAIYGVVKMSGDNTSPDSQYVEIDWRKLRELDYETGERSDSLAKLDGTPVKIPGFVVPLDDEASGGLSEFLLVPSPQACIHVPPPPPNQMVMVRMRGSEAPKRSWGPVWVMGRLHISTVESEFGNVSYMLHGDLAEPYKMEGG